MRIATILLLALSTPLFAATDDPFNFEFTEIADDVWMGERLDSSRFPVMGNTIFVITDEGVVVYDGGGAAKMAEQVIAKIRSLTDTPVTHVITSHWHGDHNFGVYRFGEEFPNVTFIAHRFTNDMMHSPRLRYIDGNKTFATNNRERFQEIVDTGIDAEGNAVSDADRRDYQSIIDDLPAVDAEFQRLRVTPATLVIDDEFALELGGRVIELKNLGHANTAGDLVMWLPQERIVATGDIVVLPSPYAFNVPPRPWAQTLRNLKALDFKTLVPGHGAPQQDTQYVDLLIEVAEDIADQRDALLAGGMAMEEVAVALDFGAFEERFTGGDENLFIYYDAYFVQPFRAAAMKALTGEDMVPLVKADVIPFDDKQWTFDAERVEVVDYLGREAFRIMGGSAVLKEQRFTNAVVEFDIAANADRTFAGLEFRRQDEFGYEHFYIRPHQSGNPDANQYTPVIGGVSGWQLYHGAGYGVPVEYKVDEWMHVKIVFANSRADVYIDSDEPVLRVDSLKREVQSGDVALSVGNFAPAYFSNFTIMALPEAFELPSRGPVTMNMPAGRVLSWQVTNSPNDDSSWADFRAEDSGILNLANAITDDTSSNTMVARFVVESDGERTKELDFGYSDSAAVYLNGTLVYKGDNTYQSRDYRYLGTIGLFDTVVLPLKAGRNDIRIAVTEQFGGWGVMAEFADIDGITIP